MIALTVCWKRAETARKVSAQKPSAREGCISFVWPCLHPIYSKNIKNNKTEFNFTQMIALTVCWKRALKQLAIKKNIKFNFTQMIALTVCWKRGLKQRAR